MNTDEGGRPLIARLQRLPLKHAWLRWAVLAMGLAFSAGSTCFVHFEVQEEARSRFTAEAVSITHDLDSRLRAYGDVLYALRGLFDASDEVTRDAFRGFARALALRERYPGLTNISYSFRVPHDRKEAFEQAIRNDPGVRAGGLPEFAIKPPGARPEYMVLTYVEPMGENIAAWGLDLNADPLRRAVVDRARDGGRLASGSGVTLVRDRDTHVASTLLRLAVYRGGGVPQTVEERQRLYAGMVGSTVRISEMVAATLPPDTFSRVRLRIYESGDASAPGGRLLFDSAVRDSGSRDAEFLEYAVRQRLIVGDREWQLEIVPRVDPEDELDLLVIAGILAAGLAISALLFWLVSTLVTSESRGDMLAQRNREAALLKGLGEDLHSCLNLQEAYETIARDMPKLLPATAGSVFMFEDSRSLANCAASWGTPAALPGGFSPSQCQAVRRGRAYLVDDPVEERNCLHFAGAAPAPYACVALSAQNEMIGTMHVQRPGSSAPCAPEELMFIEAAAQHVALALANLALREKLHGMAMRDKLTGLYNRHYMQEWIEQELHRSARDDSPLGVVMFDVDHFKRFNDSFGHEAGDLVLRELADVVRRVARKSDVACRHGGEEFLLLMPGAPLDAALRKAEELREAVARMKLDYQGRSLGAVTISLGVAAYPGNGATPETLLRSADEALYAAKAGGRNRCVVGGAVEAVPIAAAA